MTRQRLIGPITLCIAALLACPACTKKKPTDACTPAVKRTRQYLGAICRAWRSVPRGKHKRLTQMSLAQVDLPLVKTLPDAPLAVLGPGWLVLENNIVKLWSSHWKRSKSAKPAPEKRAQQTKRLARELRKHHRANNRAELLLAIAVNTPMNQVVSFLDLVQRAGYMRVAFLLSPKNRPPVPSATPGEPAKARLAPTSRRAWSRPNLIHFERVAKPWRAKRCKDVILLLDSLQKAGTTDDCGRLTTNVRKAITRCGCAVDERPLLALLHRWIGPYVFVALHRVTLSPKAKPVKVTDGSAPWSKLLVSVLKVNPRAFRLTGFTLDPSASGTGSGDGPHKRKGEQLIVDRFRSSGELDAATIRRVVRRHLSELKDCYKKHALSANPKLAGGVTARWTIRKNGTVAGASIHKTTLKHKPTEKCFLRAIRRWRFPKHTGALPKVTHSFRFKPDARPDPGP